ncbi:hypothetical protein FHS96_005622 [Sphingomonas zeicaulis]
MSRRERSGSRRIIGASRSDKASGFRDGSAWRFYESM